MNTPRGSTRRDLDPALDDVMPHRIRNKIRGQPPKQLPVTHRPSRLEHHNPPQTTQIMRFKRLSRHHRKINRLTPQQPPPAPSQHKTRLQQPLLLPTHTKHILTDLPPPKHILLG